VERDLERKLIAFVKNQGGEIRKVQWIGRRGAPDRLIFYPGHTIWVELKNGTKGRLSMLQRREILLMKRLGLHVEVIRYEHEFWRVHS